MNFPLQEIGIGTGLRVVSTSPLFLLSSFLSTWYVINWNFISEWESLEFKLNVLLLGRWADDVFGTYQTFLCVYFELVRFQFRICLCTRPLSWWFFVGEKKLTWISSNHQRVVVMLALWLFFLRRFPSLLLVSLELFFHLNISQFILLMIYFLYKSTQIYTMWYDVCIGWISETN